MIKYFMISLIGIILLIFYFYFKIILLIYNRVVDKMKVVYPFYESVIIKKPKKVNV